MDISGFGFYNHKFNRPIKQKLADPTKEIYAQAIEIELLPILILFHFFLFFFNNVSANNNFPANIFFSYSLVCYLRNSNKRRKKTKPSHPL